MTLCSMNNVCMYVCVHGGGGIHCVPVMAPPHRLEEIGAHASKEYSLEKGLEKMKTEWADMEFSFTLYRDTVRGV